jgi:hypothetical protein
MRNANLILRVAVMVSILAGCGNVVISPAHCATISGTIPLQGWTDNTCPVIFELRNPGQTIVLQPYPKVTGSDGSYTIENVSPGTYDLAAYNISYPRNYLREIQQVVVEEGTPCIANFKLRGGDCNSSNSVNIQDLNMLKLSYGKSKGQPGYDEKADFDRNGAVNIKDLNILKLNYGKSGAPPGVPDPTAPVVTITSPTPGEVVSGNVSVSITASDTQGDNPGIVGVDLYADNKLVDAIDECNPQGTWVSFLSPNGRHILQAFAIDGDGKTGWSIAAPEPVTDVNTDNFISSVNAPRCFIRGGVFPITASLKGPSPYTVEIKSDGNVIRTYEELNPATTVNVQWDGTGATTDDIYEYSITAPAGSSVSDLFVVTGIPLESVQVLIFLPFRISGMTKPVHAVVTAAQAKGMRARIYLWDDCTWDVLSTALRDGGGCNTVYIYTYGNYAIGNVQRTYFRIYGDRVVSYKGGLPGNWDDIAKSMEDLGLSNSGKIKIAYIDACYSGRYDDMAWALGMYSESSYQYIDQTYVGWYEKILASNVISRQQAFTKYMWNYLGQGLSVYEATLYTVLYYPYGYIVYDNLRWYGSPFTTWLEP